jgi:hypothetical protein
MSFHSAYYRLPGYRASVNFIYAVILRNLAILDKTIFFEHGLIRHLS